MLIRERKCQILKSLKIKRLELSGMQKKKIGIRRGGSVANDAKRRFEEETGRKVVSSLNAKNKILLEVKNKKEDK